MKIYNSKDQLLLDVIVDDSSYRHRVIKGDHNLTLKYSLAEHVELPVGAYCQYQGERYTLERPESFQMKHSRNFEYTVIMEAYQAKAKIWKFRNTVDGRLKFPLTAKPIEHLQMFVDNMNRRDKGWTIGQCVDDVEHLISYDHDFCWDALGKMATEFKTEFEIVGKRVSLRKVEYNKSNPLPLAYGCGNGFKAGLGRSNSSDTPPVEILYVQGGTQNIDRSKYGNSELLLPKGQSIAYDGEHFEGEAGFNAANARRYVVDEQGLSIRRADKSLSSLAEDSLDCTTIYPKRVGTISSVVAVDASKNFYDIIDNSIPAALNFEKCLIAGETMTVIFQSGMLAGREFEVKYYHDTKTIKGVQKAARRFEIVPQEIDGITMPNATFSPRTGDKYAVFKVMLPQAYICDNATKTGAEWDMFKTAAKNLFDNEEQKFTFTGELDGIWAKKDWVNIGGRIVLGGYILFRDERFQKDGVLLRITGIKDYINKPHSPVIEISNKTVSGGFTSDLKKLESGEVLVEEYHKDALQFTKRRFRDAKETMGMLEAAMMENFTNSISPIAIQTMQMLVGDESLQFRFVNNRIKPVTVDHKIIFDNATKQLKAAAGLIQHLTIGIKSISTNHSVSEYKFWNVSSFTSARLDKPSDTYYLYIKANKANETADFILSKKIIKMEEVNGYYHFLVGLLGSEYEGERSFTPLYGFTEILPGRITTDKIVSGDGASYFDMLANAMKLGDMLQYNVNGDGRLKLRGTIVQSQSGDESPIGCFRGVFSDSYTYYSGDEVTYLINGSYSTYRYINATPSKGHLPTETAYWTIIAQGQKGDKGQQGQKGQDGSNGKDGRNGIDGKNGQDGKNAYTFVRYSDDNGKTFTKAKDFVENDEYGSGRNLVGFNCKLRYFHVTENKSINGFEFVKASTPARIQNIWGSKQGKVMPSGIYRLSGLIKADAACTIVLQMGDTNAREGNIEVTTDWKPFSVTVNNTNYLNAPYFGFVDLEYPQGNSKAYIKDFMVTMGEEVYDYTPAPEDMLFGLTQGKYLGVVSWDKPYPPSEPNMYQWSKVEGDGVEYIYCRTEIENVPTAPVSVNKDGDVPNGWTDVPSGVSADYPFEYVSTRRQADGVWGNWSAPKLWINYATWNANLLEQTEFESIDKLNKWDVRSRNYNGSTDGSDVSHIGKNGKDGHNYYVDAYTGRYSEGQYKDVLQQPLFNSSIKKIQPSTWYTLSFWERCGVERLAINKTSSDYGFAHQQLYLFKGHKYTLYINGCIDAQALSDKKSLAVNVYNSSWTWSKEVKINSTSYTTVSIEFNDVPSNGEYVLTAYLHDSSAPRKGKATLAWVRLVDETEIARTYIHPSAVDTAMAFIDGVRKANVGTDLMNSYKPTGEWRRHVITFKTKSAIPSNAVQYLLFRLLSAPITGQQNYLHICMPKLEIGKVATAYSPNAGDMGADYQEYRFAKNGSTTTAPSLNKTVDAPTGWTLEQPTIGKMEYLWVTIAKKRADGTLLTSWSEPVRMTPYDGKDGKDGVSPALVFCGVYDPAKTYYGNQYRIDACKYENAYYVCRVDAGEVKGIVPTNTEKWNSFGASFESVATQLLLAENANIAGWIFRNGKLYSQNGSTYLDGINGDVDIKGRFLGQIKATSGSFKGSNGLYEISFDADDRIISIKGPRKVKKYNDFTPKEGTEQVEYLTIGKFIPTSGDSDGWEIVPQIVMNGLTSVGCRTITIDPFNDIVLKNNINGKETVAIYSSDGFFLDLDNVPKSRNMVSKGFMYLDGETVKIRTS